MLDLELNINGIPELENMPESAFFSFITHLEKALSDYISQQKDI